ncbi:putative tetratricopeptide-like helical domain, DYW domain-containing protein [Rosa chinensis]|uniref:Putative tetratricopeptide-like helical domain, DYW domain-containing protein n=1 Tax=Rosa chinensis TaxID=74649 RepID=A0A2P6RTD7_ROSCH|nr:pentatricopeptide repeat-containing protein At3g22690 [Rosa chinensis]XP_040371034.1 pentatricopeptide repeat-containing protein At3g22690 [Rosa chinensis]XP_040371035.1 pentatricopeptide repeat-containing protein At3g22690 [Rosa chinensis]XP_040371036.1 pentatricopeptide repeat-containing protein At3g22690 [Rosa chinensis]XP_040371037.1 pentatricopeptide repeat-containing protein At3g22690 [Rosa chinensis]XP_040371038.1 pentatricopeptide repeat-containing protein At3g22690 [Rosa chinensis]
MAAMLQLSPLVSATPSFIAPTNQNEPKAIAKDTSPTGSLRNCKTINQVKQLHCHITKTGFSHTPSNVTKLISACAEMGTFESLDYARKAFNLFLEEEETKGVLFMYNSLIRGYSSAGLCDEAIGLYVQMVLQGVLPDKFTFPFALSACSKIVAFCEGVQLHGSLVKTGLEEDVFIGNSLIHFYAECGHLDYAQKVFDEMLERNIVSWTSLICGYGRRNMPKQAVSLFFEMVAAGVKPNSVTMVCVISACAKLKDVALSERVCAYIGESGLKTNMLMVNSLVDMYMKCGATDAAKWLFDECVDKNLVLYNTILSNYVRQGLASEAVSVVGEMLQQGLRPDKVTMLAAISACAQLSDSLSGKCCHGYVLRNGLEGWDTICNAMIDMYMKCGEQEMACIIFDNMSNKTVVSWNSLISGFIRSGDVKSAWEIFNEMPKSDLVSWNTMIGALVQESKFEEAIELFREMQTEGIKGDRVTMVEVASACGYLGALDLAKWTHAYIEKSEIKCDTRLGTALVDMFAKCGDPQSAMKVFNTMAGRDVSAWTAAIRAMAMEGNGKRALELFDDMLKQGVKPDEVVFVAVLTACSHVGLLEQGRNIFMSMQLVHGISPHIVHYGCMVDLLGRAGLLEEAVDLIKCMPMEPNDVIWGTLLAACRTHKNVEMATYAAEQISKLTTQRTGIHVLLSNIYASAGKWADVAKVRLQLKERGIQKVPGSSSIEVNGVIHEFTSGGDTDTHTERSHIALMLQEINSRLRDAGYIPDLDNVLVDVDEKEKEYLLSRHSEKVAIAFGLIGTGQGVPIRVVKNLRMCSDCHSFAKLVSRIYDREIIVRDNNRFHFFSQGLCSCSDYW